MRVQSDKNTQQQHDFKAGDHIYSWCHVFGIPSFTHHGIVSNVTDTGTVTIIDFTNFNISDDNDGHNSSFIGSVSLGSTSNPKTLSRSDSSFGDSRVRELSLDEWEFMMGNKPQKVQYQKPFIDRFFSAAGTCTAASSDPVGLVVARVRFLLENQDLLPSYHVLRNNCECFAVWCKTGTYATLQAASFLNSATLVHAGATPGVYATVARQTVTLMAPSPGLWGYLGYETATAVPLMAVNPFIGPGILVGGTLLTAWQMKVKHDCQNDWKKMTCALSDQFWSSAGPDVFLACIVDWSGLVNR